ncbi:MAG: ATP-binding cassette domain-containing protein [Desulfobacterales bacterium]|nr:MAG: ATP-binding cassette domain-containing protein [Desulfobacterales bacterium]
MQAIQTANLSKTYWYYEKKSGLSGSLKALLRGRKVLLEAVRNVTMELALGEVVGFIGPNGAGKTTTLKMLSGILHPTEGTVTVMGFTPSERKKDFLKHITFVSGQRNRLFWDLPAAEFFEFCRVVYAIPADVFQERLQKLVALAEIGAILNVPQRKLSFGQRKRCELAAGLLHDPKVIFLDEPTNAMDLINAGKIRKFIRELGEGGRHTIILTSHNMSDIEQVCDRVIVINQGQIVFDGDMRALQRLDGFNKQIRIVFDGPWSVARIQEMGVIRQMSGSEILLEVAPDDATALASRLLSEFAVKDISITEPRLEAIIENIFARRTG